MNNLPQKRQSNIGAIIARLFGVILFIPASMLYIFLFMIIDPIQYIFTGKHTIAGKYHKFIDNIIGSNGL